MLPFEYTYICIYIYMENRTVYRYMLPFKMENRKWKPRQFSLICLLFAHCAMKVCPLLFLTKKQMEVIRLQID